MRCSNLSLPEIRNKLEPQTARPQNLQWLRVRPDPGAAAIARELGLQAGLERTMGLKTSRALASASASKAQAALRSGDATDTEME